MVFISMEKLYVSAYIGHLLSEPEDDRYRPKHVVFPY